MLIRLDRNSQVCSPKVMVEEGLTVATHADGLYALQYDNSQDILGVHDALARKTFRIENEYHENKIGGPTGKA